MTVRQTRATKTRLDDISTEWSVVRDPPSFVQRYALAIQTYLIALVRNHHDAEEVAQNFFLRVSQHCFVRTREERGRFRDYLKVSVRNAALNYLQRHRAEKSIEPGILQAMVSDRNQATAEQSWIAEWRRCLLERACRALESHQNHSPGNLFHTVLNMVVDNPLDDTSTLASRISVLLGRPLRAEAFRKQVSRARFMLAKLIVKEVAETLDNPTREQIKEELIELSLWEYLRDFLVPRNETAKKKKDLF